MFALAVKDCKRLMPYLGIGAEIILTDGKKSFCWNTL